VAADYAGVFGSHDQSQGRPALYLDVDGVLNPWRSKGPHKHWPGYTKQSVTVPGDDTYRLWIARDLAAALLALCDCHGIEIVWATSWAVHIAFIEDAYGFPAGFPVLPVPEITDSFTSTGKVDLVAAHAGDHRPVIWVDDCLGPDDRRWASARAAATLLMRPNPAVGLRRADLDTIAAWLTHHPARPVT
jgi:hypothetical protein